MAKKLYWKAFEAHEEQSEYSRKLYIEMTMGQRLERFFMLLEIRSELVDLARQEDPNVFNLRRT